MSNIKEPGIPAYYLIIICLPVILLLLFITHYYNSTHLVNEVWKKENTFSMTAKVNQVFSENDSKGRTYWTYADLDNGDLLINPFHGNMLCHTLTAPRDGDLIKGYDIQALQDAKEAPKNSPTHFTVKAIPSIWIEPDKQSLMRQDCPHLDFSGKYLTYRGRRVVELLELVD